MRVISSGSRQKGFAMRGVLCVVLAMVSAFVAAEQEKCPVSANVRGHENIGIAPNCEGLLDAEDVKALKDFGDLKRLFFSREVKGGEPFNVIVMQEDVAQGELVDDWKLLIDGMESLAGRSIGVKRIRILNEPLSASSVEIKVSSLTGMVPSVRSRRYYAEPGLVKAILSATTDSGETDPAQWMSGKKKPE